MPMLIRPNIADGVRRCIRMAIRVAIETGHALMRTEAAPILDGVELLLRKRRDQETQSLQLLRIENVGNSRSKL